MPLLQLNNLSKSFQDGETKRTILDSIDFTLDEGKIATILGPSGAGKSTLLNIIGTLEKPNAGQVQFENDNIASYNEEQLRYFRNQSVGFIFQLHHLLPQCTLLENVLVPTIPTKVQNKQETEQWAEELLKKTGLIEHQNKYPAVLSGGERQRAAVVRAMINKPKLLLADEPTGALDKKNADNLTQLLIDINSTFNLSMIIVTHSEDQAKKTGNIHYLENGKLVKQ